jgi:Arabinose-binding domain of AraC transcription regulator, N-term
VILLTRSTYISFFISGSPALVVSVVVSTSCDLDDPDARLPAPAWTALIEEATRQRSLPNLALRLAAEMPLGAFPLLDYVVVTSDTVGEGPQAARPIPSDRGNTGEPARPR